MAENQDEHEDVVDRQALLEQVAGQVLEPLAGSLDDEDRAAEQQANDDVAGGEQQGFADADPALLPADDADIEGEQRQEYDDKAAPEPERGVDHGSLPNLSSQRWRGAKGARSRSRFASAGLWRRPAGRIAVADSASARVP